MIPSSQIKNHGMQLLLTNRMTEPLSDLFTAHKLRPILCGALETLTHFHRDMFRFVVLFYFPFFLEFREITSIRGLANHEGAGEFGDGRLGNEQF